MTGPRLRDAARFAVMEVPPARGHGAMIPIRVFAAVAGLAAVSACGGGAVEELRATEARGSAFTQALTEEYRLIALREAEDDHDWRSANFFAHKGLRAARGEAVEPEWLPAWDLPADKLDELNPARRRLILVMVKGAQKKLPEQTAMAQGRFDCWVFQSTRSHQSDDMATCREEFFAALEQAEAAI